MMQNIRLPLLLKLAIIFLAVMVVPAAIVAVYVKQQFDDINLQNRLDSLEYGRASLSALMDEQWRSLDTLSRALKDSGPVLRIADSLSRERVLDSGRGLVVYDNQGNTLYDDSLDCCDPQELMLTMFSSHEAYRNYLENGAEELRMLAFRSDQIVLLFGFAEKNNGKFQDFVMLESSIGSNVFDSLRKVSGLKTSIYMLTGKEYLGENIPSNPPVDVELNVQFSTAINEYAERIDRIGIPGDVYRVLRDKRRELGGETDWVSQVFYDADFITTMQDPIRREMIGVLPLLNSREGLFLAEVTIPTSDREAPEEIEYLWVIISSLFILVLLMSLLITMYVVAPIMNLNQGVESLRKSVGSERGFEELAVQSNDEIGDLANSFNLLAGELTLSLDKIRQQRREILEYAQNLEDKVKERTQEAEAARVRAEMANVHKSKFLVNMNHEFRTPLNSISGITDLLSYGAYDKNDDMAVLLEEVGNTLGNRAPEELTDLRDFLFEDSNTMYLLQERLNSALEKADLTEDEREYCSSQMEALRKLIDEEERGKLKAYGNISEAGKTLIHIVDDVINLSRIESGAIDIHPEESSISEIVNYAMVHSESYSRAKGKTALLELEHKLSQDIPDRIVIDHYRIKQILMNLMSNAIKYTESGRIILKVDREPAPTVNDSILMDASKPGDEGPDAEVLRFSVKDQGIGIDPKDHHLIFREFGRTFKVRDIEGTGLGLAISRKLVEAHGGQVGFSSSPGEGSEFWFIVPLVLPGTENHSP